MCVTPLEIGKVGIGHQPDAQGGQAVGRQARGALPEDEGPEDAKPSCGGLSKAGGDSGAVVVEALTGVFVSNWLGEAVARRIATCPDDLLGVVAL
jgi:hypothetical protein